MRTTGYFYVADYDHQGDIDRCLDKVKEIDPSYIRKDIKIYKEDPEADCETCEIHIEFDYAKVNELCLAFQDLAWDEPVEVVAEPENALPDSEEDITVYVTKTGKSYKLKQDRKWAYAKKLSEAIDAGMYLYASKK